MIARFFILIFMVTMALDLSAQAKAYQAKGKAKSKAKAPEAAPVDEGPPPMHVPQGYKYDRKGRRDPFINPVPKPVASEDDKPVVPAVRPPGLKGVLVNEVNITGVVSAKDPSQNVAVISAPGGKRYFAHRGDALFDAIIKEIRSDGVVFVLSSASRANTPPREIERKVRQPGAK